MTPALLHAISRRADAMTPDADLLARSPRARDAGAFEELVRRHGPLVWSVCRQALPERADAEDAFQAVFLALVRSADRIRDGRTLPAWLHGVAVRVAMRARREFARRKARERAAAAASEADRPVSDTAWESLAAALHEEVQRLPEAERTAFVLCELQGVSQPDAAARLGWPLGSLSGRLCRARQRLLSLLAARGIAPAAAVGVGITAGAACAVPEGVFEVVKSFPGAPGAASSAAAALARGLVEGVAMRVKLTAAAVVLAAFGLTGGAVWLSKAEAQPDAGKQPPVVGQPLKPPRGAEGAGAKPKKPGGQPPAGAAEGHPGAGGFVGGGAGGPGPGGAAGWSVAHPAWEYKFVDASNDRKEFEKVITQHGKDGWEFCGSERFSSAAAGGPGMGAMGPAQLVLVFKRPKGSVGFGGMGAGPLPGMPGGIGGAGGGAWMGGAGGAGGGGKMGPGGTGGAGMWGNWGGKDGVEVRSFTLKYADAAQAGESLKKVVPAGLTAVVPDPRSNRLLVVADAAAMKGVARFIEQVDTKDAIEPPGVKPKPGPMGAPGGGTGTALPGSGPRWPGGVREPELTVLTLKNAEAQGMEQVLKKVFPTVQIVAEMRSNTLIIRADAKTLEELKALIAKLDVSTEPW
jgi:RNA polymerase sigma factor (sigma-70 family)